MNTESYLSIEHGWNMATIDRQISDIIDCGFELVRIARNYELSSSCPMLWCLERNDRAAILLAQKLSCDSP